MSAQVFDQTNITEAFFEAYRLLHHKAAGRVTRPLSTFRMMFEWIQRGLAVLSCAMLNEKPVGFALSSVYKDGAYYSSGCEDPEFNLLNSARFWNMNTEIWCFPTSNSSCAPGLCWK